MGLIDSHCHLLGFRDNGSLNAVLERAAAVEIEQFITVGTSPKDWVPYREMSAAYEGRIHYTVGLHPCYVDAEWADAVDLVAPFFMPPHAPIALGEIGLDYFHLPKDPVAAGQTILHQEAAFKQQLSLAHELDLPVIIHSRDAFEDTFNHIDQSGINWRNVVFHCFSYGPDEIRRIQQRGGRASFTGILTYKSAEPVRQALLAQGTEQLMLETDCPYLAPEPHRGKPNEPAYLSHIAQRAAEVFNQTPEALAAKTTRNTREFFRID